MASEDLANNIDQIKVCLEDWVVIESIDVPSQDRVEALLKSDTAEALQNTVDSSFEPEQSQEQEESSDKEEEDIKVFESEGDNDASEEEADVEASEEKEESESSEGHPQIGQEVCCENWVVIENADVPSFDSSVEALPDTTEPSQTTLDSSFGSDIEECGEEYFEDDFLLDAYGQPLSKVDPESSQEQGESLDEKEKELEISEEEEDVEASEKKGDIETTSEEEPQADQDLHPTFKNHLNLRSNWTREKADSSSKMLWIFIISLIIGFSLLLVSVRMETLEIQSQCKIPQLENGCLSKVKTVTKRFEKEMDDLKEANNELLAINCDLNDQVKGVSAVNAQVYKDIQRLKVAQENSKWILTAYSKLSAQNNALRIENFDMKNHLEEIELEKWHMKKKFATATEEVKVLAKKTAEDKEELARSNKQLHSSITDLKYQLHKARKEIEDFVEASRRELECHRKFPNFMANFACISEAIFEEAHKQLIKLLRP